MWGDSISIHDPIAYYERVTKAIDEIDQNADKPIPDNVNHPEHYETGKFECIEVMQEALGADVTKDFCLGNAFKYIYRCQKKHESPVEDVKKAQWYLGKFLELEK